MSKNFLDILYCTLRTPQGSVLNLPLFLLNVFALPTFAVFWRDKMAEKKDVCSSSPARTSNLQLTAEQPSTGECWIPQHIQGQRRSLSKMVGRAKSRLESNSIPARDAWRPHTKPSSAHQDPETPQR